MTGNTENARKSGSGVGEGGTERCGETGVGGAWCEGAGIGGVGGVGGVGRGARNGNDNRFGAVLQRPIQKPTPYDGRTPWDAYHTQFELLAGVNGWTDAEKATFLAISLQGSALTLLSNLSAEHQGNYRMLVAALESRFRSTHQTELNRAKLRSRTRKREESLPELAEDIERLARLSYPGADAGIVEMLAKD